MILKNDDSIDVIIPARGVVPWLELSLSSIASQTLQPLTVTLVDDGLEDAGAAEDLGKKLFGECFRLIQNRGHGISAALNTGIEQSSASWIARMDADDIAYPDRLKKQLDFLMSHSHSVLGCGTQVRFINSSGKSLASSRLPASWRDITQRLRSQTCFVHSSLMIRRDVLLATPYRPNMDGAEDVDLILRLTEKVKILNLDEVLLGYRIHLTQESFRLRARHTAVQELAFRLAGCREKTFQDPVDHSPDLAEKFVMWRLSTPGYVRARTALTALRYAGLHLSGRDFQGLMQCTGLGLKSLPMTPASLRVAWRVYWKAGAALLDSRTPFEALNVS